MTNNSINLTIHTSPTNLPFLDIWINLENSKFSFNCFQKPLNSYQYLPFSSDNPIHVKQNFISNELKRYLVRESTPIGYLEIKKGFFLRNTLIHKLKNKSSLTPTIFKLRYSKNSPKLGIHSFLQDLHADLSLDPQLKDIPKPFICWTKSKSLYFYLIKTKYIRSLNTH